MPGSRTTQTERRGIAVMGLGAMGASLAAITAIHVPTVVVARSPDHARRIRTNGICVEGALEAEARPDVVTAIDDLADIHPIDLVFIATKTTAIADACEAMRPQLQELPYMVS